MSGKSYGDLPQTLAWSTLAVTGFQSAYAIPWFALPFQLLFAYALVRLLETKSSRGAFYAGLAVGFTLAAIQLTFFATVFGSGAIALWLIIGLWFAHFTWLGQCIGTRFPRWAVMLTPIAWVGLEYFRSELYYLRFSWVTPGMSLADSPWSALLKVGTYGAGGLILFCGCLLRKNWRMGFAGATILLIAPPFLALIGSESTRSLLVAGIQLEHPDETALPQQLERVVANVPECDLILLSEYTLNGAVPESLRRWCDEHDWYLIVGGKDAVDELRYYNTAFVVGPEGDIVFKQAKSVPIQFFRDGLPAEDQAIWDSPFGPIGICVCYDLSYSRVIDRFIERGACAIVNPTMDAIAWGGRQHRLHSRVPVCRSIEYDIPIARLASSGVSLVTDGSGRRLAEAGFPGQGNLIAGRLRLSEPRLPVDRWISPACVVATLLMLVACLWPRKTRGDDHVPETLGADLHVE
ncbi:MAG: nitrilase-related carbon-nitrogen hydrolase [Planctomycetota bacterium]